MRIHWLPLVLLPGCADGAAGSLPPQATRGGSFELGIPLLAPGLLSAVPGVGRLQVEFELPEQDFESALFLSTDRATLFSGSVPMELEDESELTLEGLPDGTLHYLGIGLRHAGEVDYVQVGPILSVRTGAPIYVDASADPALADGTSPQTAYVDPVLALLDAFVQGGGNLWVRGGDYTVANLPVFAGVHVYGGFDEDFDIEERDPATFPTRWIIPTGGIGVQLLGPGPPIVLDGLSFIGSNQGAIGIDVLGISSELRRVEVIDFQDRGIRVRNITGEDMDLLLVGCALSDNGADGLSLSGPMDVTLDRSNFLRNGQEGVELDALIALSGDTARLRVRGSLFAGNRSEGLDADLSAPLVPVGPPGDFSILIEGSRFEANGLDGLLIDVDFETAPGWSADITVLDSRARANAGSGFHVDADSVSQVFFHRVLASANVGDGLLITSESQTGLALVGTSVFSANLGAGVRSILGNFAPVLSHCALAGNQGGGFVSERVSGVASSCVFWLQPDPLVGCVAIASPRFDDPLQPPFQNAGEAFLQVSGIAAASLTVTGATAVAPNAVLELADDGQERVLQGFHPSGILLAEAIQDVQAPTSLVAFPNGSNVLEDYGLSAGSGAAGAGLVPPGGAARDAGPTGSPGSSQSEETLANLTLPFRFVGTTPAQATGVSNGADIEIRFSEELDPASLALDQVRVVDDARRSLPASSFVEGDVLRLVPPPAGWGTQNVGVELHAGLSSAAGQGLATPALLIFRVR